MKLIIASLLACASAIPIELTPEVAEATAAHLAAVAQNEAGEHAALAPINSDVQAAAPVHDGVQIAAAYLDDLAEVAEAKAAFKAAFDAAAAGEHAALAPVNNDVHAPAPLAAAPVVVAKAAAPAVLPHAYYGGYGYNGLGYAGLAYNGLGYAGLGYAGLGYHGLGYAGYGYGLPVVAAPAPA